MTSPHTRRYRQRGAPIIHDTIDNETIAINQLTGAYYSLEGASALAWQRLEQGASAADIGAVLANAYEGDRAQIDAAVDAFLAELIDEQLIVVDESPATESAHVASLPAQAQAPFAGLRLQRYTDLEVMLLADPIHEVDDSGWPMPIAEKRR